HPRALADAPYQNSSNQGNDAYGQEVEDDRDAEDMRRIAVHRVGAGSVNDLCRRTIIHRQPGRNGDAESRQKGLTVVRPTDGDSNITNRVFNNQIPTDDPSGKLAEGSISIGVG